METVFDIVKRHIEDTATSWSIGTFGAIAEFHREADEPVQMTQGKGWIAVTTERGALRIDSHPKARLFPYETISKIPSAWSQGVMVCLPDDAAALSGRTGVTALDFDDGSLMPAGGDGRFDLGFGLAHIDVCVRTHDPALIDALSQVQGTAFVDLPPATVKTIKACDPTRVFVSRMGRIEVAQSIPASRDATPMGPHTHVLPALLGRGRAQAANIPVPEGWSIALAFYPPHPVRTADGSLKGFDRVSFDAFQKLIDDHAPADLSQAKRQAWQLLETNAAPDTAAVPDSRHARTAFRVALRQWELLNGTTVTSAAWRGLCDSTRIEAGDADPRPDHEGSI